MEFTTGIICGHYVRARKIERNMGSKTKSSGAISTNLKLVLISIVLISLLCIVGRYFWYVKYDVPYKNFKDSEATAVPLFIAHNEKVYSEVPPPPGVKETNKSESTASVQHGVVLQITYEIENSDMNTIMNYYEKLFLSKKWEKYELRPKIDYAYYQDTSCFEILGSSPSSSGKSEYLVFIYQDYFDQSFSPKIKKIPFPPIGLHEFGETQFVRCPPFLDAP